MAKKRKKRRYNVSIQFHAFGVEVLAHSEAEAKRIAFQRLVKRSYGYLIDKNNTYADSDD
ncbi:hypothetical protein GGR92_005250 [Spirosoma lacussanchae]